MVEEEGCLQLERKLLGCVREAYSWSHQRRVHNWSTRADTYSVHECLCVQRFKRRVFGGRLVSCCLL